jgi:peptidase M28-like protein
MFETHQSQKDSRWKHGLVFSAMLILLTAGWVFIRQMTQMPLRSYSGPLPSLTGEEKQLRDRLAKHVDYLSSKLGERDGAGSTLDLASQYLQHALAESGYSVNIRPYTVGGKHVQNLEAILKGVNEGTDTLVVGAHYDSAHGTPGADDNASGSAAILEIARLLRHESPARNIRFVLFANEEPPYFQTDRMGSLVYARELAQSTTHVTAMISIETIGFYSDAPKSQKYPILVGLLYPSEGNFVGFVGDTGSRDLVRQTTKAFRESCEFPSEGLSAPSSWPGVGWSDHWSFWKQGVPAIMVTDTALFRNPHYHRSTDTQDKLDFDKLARVVSGLSRTLVKMANEN